MSKDFSGVATKTARMPAKAVEPSAFSDLRLATLGIPAREFTPAVSLAISALFEKIDDLNQDLKRTKETLDELEQLVDVDVLAPIPNRRAFMRRLEWAVSMHQRYGHPVSLLYFDINEFKSLNDTYGHACGDAALKHVAGILKDSTRDSDFIARMGGDEFAVILFNSDYDNAIKRAKALSTKISVDHQFKWNGKVKSISAAVGVYMVKSGDTSESALTNTDTAMYIEKRRYKNESTDNSGTTQLSA